MNRHQRNRRREFAKLVNRKAMFCAAVRLFTIKIETPFLDALRRAEENIYQGMAVPIAFLRRPSPESTFGVGYWPVMTTRRILTAREWKAIAEDPDLEDQYHG